jgi:predicted hydrolase (HD superfamily)
MGVRGHQKNRFLFTGPEMSAVKVVVELHDQQLDNCTVKEMEQALFIVDEVIRLKKARAIVPQSQLAA